MKNQNNNQNNNMNNNQNNNMGNNQNNMTNQNNNNMSCDMNNAKMACKDSQKPMPNTKNCGNKSERDCNANSYNNENACE